MAKIKSLTSNGVTGEYWHIYKLNYNKDNNETLIRLRCYVDSDTRNSDIEDYLDMNNFKKSMSVSGFKTIAEAYTALSESVLDEEDNETNWFYDATDDTEWVV